MTNSLDYTTPGPFTDLADIDRTALATVPADPIAICTPVPTMVIQPHDAKPLGLPADRFAERNIRPAVAIVRQLLELDPADLTVPRPPDRRVIGTCRHFAVLATALLRHRGIPARARCGFATYFQPGKGLDHWVIEYHGGERWIRLDAEILDKSIVSHPEDLRPWQFLTGGEAWQAFRRGEIDARQFGVYGTENWGPAEIMGNAVRDLAALNKLEMLPWDDWGRMAEAYQGKTGPDYDELMDEVATVCASDDAADVTALYRHESLRVPVDLSEVPG